MDFIDYCVATKNYSALNTVNEYVKTFSGEIGKGLKYGVGFGVGMAGVGAGLGAIANALEKSQANKVELPSGQQIAQMEANDGEALDDVDA